MEKNLFKLFILGTCIYVIICCAIYTIQFGYLTVYFQIHSRKSLPNEMPNKLPTNILNNQRKILAQIPTMPEGIPIYPNMRGEIINYLDFVGITKYGYSSSDDASKIINFYSKQLPNKDWVVKKKIFHDRLIKNFRKVEFDCHFKNRRCFIYIEGNTEKTSIRISEEVLMKKSK